MIMCLNSRFLSVKALIHASSKEKDVLLGGAFSGHSEISRSPLDSSNNNVCTPDAEGRAEYEGEGESAPDHGEDVLQPEEEAEVPGRGVRDGVGDADPSPLLLLRAVNQPSRS